MKNLLKYTAAATVTFAMSFSAVAAEYTLKISSWAPPSHRINSVMWPNLIKMMEEATDGRVTAEVKLGLAPPPAQMDLVMDGAADMTIIFHGYQPGRFTASKLIELPGYTGSAEAASVAYWAVHEKYLSKLNEHRGVKLVGLTTHGPGQIHVNKKVGSLSDLKNLKTRLPGGVASDVASQLGMIGIKVPASKVYETLASGAADAVAMPYESRLGFKLTEVAPHVLEVPGGYYRGSFGFLMSQETFDKLPKDIQKALDEKVFGANTSRMLGKVWDGGDVKAIKATKANAKNTITTIGKKEQDTFKGIIDNVTEKVLAELIAKGIDAQAAYNMIKDEMAKN